MKGKKIIKNSNLFILRTFHYSSANDVQKVRSTDIKVSKILLNLTKFRYLYKKIKTIWENSLRNDSLGSHMLITKNLFVHDIFLLCINSFLNVNLLLSQFLMMMLQITQFFLFFLFYLPTL